MESWRKAWQEGILPQMDDKALLSLLHALKENNPKLIQHATTQPPSLQCVEDWDVEGACALSWLGWQGGKLLLTVGEVGEFFSRVCSHADQYLREPAGIRWFLNWYDNNPREKVFKTLAAEIEENLRQREMFREIRVRARHAGSNEVTDGRIGDVLPDGTTWFAN